MMTFYTNEPLQLLTIDKKSRMENRQKKHSNKVKVQKQSNNVMVQYANIQKVYIQYKQFQEFLTTLQTKQAQDLKRIVDNHYSIQQFRDGNSKFLKGSSKFMTELDYLVNSAFNRIQIQDELSSIESKSKTMTMEKKIYSWFNFQITEQNWKTLSKNICSLKSTFQYNYELSLKSSKPIIVVNQIIKQNQYFFIVDNVLEIYYLQAIIKEQIPLQFFDKIVNHILDKSKRSKFSIEHQEKQFWFLLNKSDNEKILESFVELINEKQKDSSVILLTSNLFQKLLTFQNKFSKQIKVAMHDQQVHIDWQKLASIQVQKIKSTKELEDLKKLCIILLKQPTKSYKFIYEQQYLDSITCFNILLAEQKMLQKTIMIFPLKKMPLVANKYYAYFTFYGTLCQIVSNETDVTLKQTTLQEQYHGRNTKQIRQMRQYALYNKIPFFILYQRFEKIQFVNIKNIIQAKTNQMHRFLLYRYLLCGQNYKIITEEENDSYLKKLYQGKYTIKFEPSNQSYEKIGKLKQLSEQIEKKKQNKFRCLRASTSYCKLLLQKWQGQIK